MVFHFNPFDMDDSMLSWDSAPVMLDWFGGGYSPYRQNQYRPGSYQSCHPMYDDQCYPSRRNTRCPSQARGMDMSSNTPVQQQHRTPVQQKQQSSSDNPFRNTAGALEREGEPNEQQTKWQQDRSGRSRRSNNVDDKKVWQKTDDDCDNEFEKHSTPDTSENSFTNPPTTAASNTTVQESSTRRNVTNPPVGVVNPNPLKSAGTCGLDKETNDDGEQEQLTEAADGKIEPPLIECIPQLYKKFKDNEDNLESLKLRITAFSGTAKDKEYIYIDEMLTKVLLSLDAIETDGIEEIRSARKKLVQRVQELVHQLESRAHSHDDISKTTTKDEPSEMDTVDNTAMDTSKETDVITN